MPLDRSKPKRLASTVKEKKFVKAYIESGNGALAVREAGYKPTTPRSAASIASDNLVKLDMQYYFTQAGFTDAAVSQNIARISFTAKKQNQYTGEVENDEAIQLRGMELGLKVLGKFAPPRAAVDAEGKTVIPIVLGLDVFDNHSD